MKFTLFAAIIGATAAIKLADDKDHSNEFFEARENGTGPLDKKYERVPPEHFATGSDDLFMKSMIMNYAQEGKDKEGAPNGQFFMTEAPTKAAAAEVLGSHKDLDGPAKADTSRLTSQEPGLTSMS